MLGRFAGAGCAIALVLRVSLAVAATATIAPLGLPAPKAGGQELRYAFGKDWENACRAEIHDDLAMRKLFDDIVPEGGDLTLVLRLDSVHRTFEDRVAVSGKGSMTFSVQGHWSWTRAGQTVAEGPVDVDYDLSLDHEPLKADLDRGWREALERTVAVAVADGRVEEIVTSAAPGGVK